jgi:hypothetical protein
VWKSKFYGAFVLNHPQLDGVAMPVPREELSDAPDALVDFHTAQHVSRPRTTSKQPAKATASSRPGDRVRASLMGFDELELFDETRSITLSRSL